MSVLAMLSLAHIIFFPRHMSVNGNGTMVEGSFTLCIKTSVNVVMARTSGVETSMLAEKVVTCVKVKKI